MWPQFFNMFLHWLWFWTPDRVRLRSIKCPGSSQLQGIPRMLQMMLIKSKPLKILLSKRQGFKQKTKTVSLVNVTNPMFLHYPAPAPGCSTPPYLLLYRLSKLASLNQVRMELFCFVLFLLWYNICREITYYVWPPGKIVLGCLDRDWYPDSATGVRRRGKKKNIHTFSWFLLLLCYVH